MPEVKTIIAAVRDYILTCPFLHDGRMGIGYLGDGIEYMIDVLPMTPVVQRYTDGSCQKQYGFALASKEEFDGDARTAIDNSGFYEQFENWIEDNNMRDILPKLPEGLEAQTIEVTTGGYVFDMEPELARYQIQCRLVYVQED